MARVMKAALLAGVAIWGWGGALSAQATGSLIGVVVDDVTLDPIANAVVALGDFSDRTRTDGNGEFTLEGVPAGTAYLRIEREGYVTSVESLEVQPSETSLLQFRMQRLGAMLGRLFVGVDDDRSRGHTESSLVADAGMSTASDILMRRVPGLSVSRVTGGAGAGLSVRLRGVSTMELTTTPAIYLDGVRIDGGGAGEALQALDQIPAAAVKRIRILRGPASTSRYPDGASGVILIETMESGQSKSGGR
jgi:TonB-dependent starch-binding outer membrane protein SusC